MLTFEVLGGGLLKSPSKEVEPACKTLLPFQVYLVSDLASCPKDTLLLKYARFAKG